MTGNDMLALALSYGYAGALLAVAELLHRVAGVSPRFTRKVVHIGAGSWIFGILALFDTAWVALLPFATFIPVNAWLHRRGALPSVDSPDAPAGTVWFALSVTTLLAATGIGDRAWIAAGGVMAMTWGDALGSLTGQTVGRHSYRIRGHLRTFEGSLAVAVGTFLAVGATVASMVPGAGLQGGAVAGALSATVASVVEAVSPAGLDNLTVPHVTALALWVLGWGMAWI
jgi:phytol kinase